MQGSNMGFSACELKFDENNWDKPQTLQAIPLPYFTDATVSREIEASFKIAALKDPSMNKNELKYKIIRDKGKGAVCQSNGDPHYLGFNGMRYDFLTCAGNYYLVKSKFLTIETITRKWENNAHTNEALAIRFGKTVYILHADKGLTCGSASKEGVEVIESADKLGFHFKLADGSEIKANIRNSRVKYIDITVELAEHAKGQVNGLCGKWVDVQKFYGPDDKETNIPPEQWGKLWVVPENDNVFACTDKCAGSTTAGYAAKPINFCQIPNIGDAKVDPPYIPPPKGYVIVKPPAYGGGIKPPAPTLKPVPPKQANPAHIAKCKEICNKVFTLPLGTKYLEPKPYQSNCISDCELAGTFDLVDGHKCSYLSKLRTIEKTLMETAREADRKLQIAVQASQKKAYGVQVKLPGPELQASVKNLYDDVHLLRDTYGLGGAKCPGGANRCTGHGACHTSGCACNKDWTGILCDISLKQGGYVTPKQAYTAKPYVPPPPKPTPPCPHAAKAAAEAAARALAKIPSVADAIAKKAGNAPPVPPAPVGDAEAEVPAEGGDAGGETPAEEAAEAPAEGGEAPAEEAAE